MQQGIMELMWRSSHVSGSNVHYVEALYEQYLDDPSAVPDEWRQYFDQLPRPDDGPSHDVPLAPVREQFHQLAKQRRTALAPPPLTERRIASRSGSCS